jgi:RHS repeat-associated protein
MFPGAWGAEEWTGTNATTDNLRDNTKEENDLGLVNQGQRYTNLQTDMFLTRDPLGFADGTNPQIYVHQNPYGHFDAEGLTTEADYVKDESYAESHFDATEQGLQAEYDHDHDAAKFNTAITKARATRDARIDNDRAGIANIEASAKYAREHGLDVTASMLDDDRTNPLTGQAVDPDHRSLGGKLYDNIDHLQLAVLMNDYAKGLGVAYGCELIGGGISGVLKGLWADIAGTTGSDLTSVPRFQVNGGNPQEIVQEQVSQLQQAQAGGGTRGLGGRVLSASEQAEFDGFAARAKAQGLIENPNRTGSWGKIVGGKFQEVTRVDVGEAGQPGFGGQTHIHNNGAPDHLDPSTKIPGEQ